MSTVLLSVTPANFQSCIDFLSFEEYRCVSLMSHLIVQGKPVFPRGSVQELVYLSTDGGNGGIDGVLLCTRTGILLHCLKEDTDVIDFARVLKPFLSRLAPRCIIGEQKTTLFLESLIPVKPNPAVDYLLMTLDTLPSDDQCTVNRDIGFAVLRASVDDAAPLFPLQEGYELEEVVPPGGPFDRDACFANLLTSLEKQDIYLVKIGGACIAKAGTNAQGLNWDQIGGVYTLPEWRGKGIASALVAFIGRERMQRGRKIALFVKITNDFAQKAYKKAGFSSKTLFRLSYYQL